jgi:hypothetical protein
MPGRSSRRSRLKPPPPRELEIDAELLANEQLGVIAAFRGADFDNTHEYFSSLVGMKMQVRRRAGKLQRGGEVGCGSEYEVHALKSITDPSLEPTAVVGRRSGTKHFRRLPCLAKNVTGFGF